VLPVGIRVVHEPVENVQRDSERSTSRHPATVIEQTRFEEFLKKHPNITAYFHGNSNWNQFYEWRGPHHTVTLPTFQVTQRLEACHAEPARLKAARAIAQKSFTKSYGNLIDPAEYHT
jgi:hypothetical protein